jgi:hypothetical protein
MVIGLREEKTLKGKTEMSEVCQAKCNTDNAVMRVVTKENVY